jgi:hypothetical protein
MIIRHPRHISVCFLLAMAVAMTSMCGPGPNKKPVKGGPVDTGMGTLAAARRYLVGTWTLLSYDLYPPGQPVLHLNGTGTLVYDDYSNLNMELKADEATSQVVAKAGINMENGVFVQKGRTAVDIQAKTLTYIFEGQTNWQTDKSPLSPQRPRHWQVDGNVLTLTTNGDDGKPVAVSKWQKVQ